MKQKVKVVDIWNNGTLGKIIKNTMYDWEVSPNRNCEVSQRIFCLPVDEGEIVLTPDMTGWKKTQVRKNTKQELVYGQLFKLKGEWYLAPMFRQGVAMDPKVGFKNQIIKLIAKNIASNKEIGAEGTELTIDMFFEFPIDLRSWFYNKLLLPTSQNAQTFLCAHREHADFIEQPGLYEIAYLIHLPNDIMVEFDPEGRDGTYYNNAIMIFKDNGTDVEENAEQAILNIAEEMRSKPEYMKQIADKLFDIAKKLEAKQ